MSIFDKINRTANTVAQAGSLVNQGSQFISDIVGQRKAPSSDYEQQPEEDDEEDDFAPPSINSAATRRRRTDADLRRMAETKGSMVFVLMKTASSAIKSVISRVLITKGTDEEVTELFSRLNDMADNEGVNVYQFVPTEEQMQELGITDKNLLLNEGKKAEKKRNLLKALEEEDPEVDAIFKVAVIESLFNKYKEEDERGELVAEGLMDVILSYSMVTIGGVFSNSGYNIIDMVLDLVIKKKPVIAPPVNRTKSVPFNPNKEDVSTGNTLEELVGNRSEELGQNLSDDETGSDRIEPR